MDGVESDLLAEREDVPCHEGFFGSGEWKFGTR